MPSVILTCRRCKALSRKILRTVREAIGWGVGERQLTEELSQPLVTDAVQSRTRPRPKPCRSRCQPDVAVVRRDYRTGALTAAVLALAVLLGWMVGRVGWSMAVNRAPAQVAITPDEAQAMAPVIPETQPGSAPPRRAAGLRQDRCVQT